MLSDLMSYCDWMGSTLDGTATNTMKFIDRQRAHRLVYKVIYGILSDDPENDNREDNMNDAVEALEQMKRLSKKEYPDKHDNL